MSQPKVTPVPPAPAPKRPPAKPAHLLFIGWDGPLGFRFSPPTLHEKRELLVERANLECVNEQGKPIPGKVALIVPVEIVVDGRPPKASPA